MLFFGTLGISAFVQFSEKWERVAICELQTGDKKKYRHGAVGTIELREIPDNGEVVTKIRYLFHIPAISTRWSRVMRRASAKWRPQI